MGFLAHHDVLTGCVNRARLGELVDEAAAAGQPVAAVLLDLDGFKRINDTYGHATGDALLREIAPAGHRPQAHRTRKARPM